MKDRPKISHLTLGRASSARGFLDSFPPVEILAFCFVFGGLLWLVALESVVFPAGDRLWATVGLLPAGTLPAFTPFICISLPMAR